MKFMLRSIIFFLITANTFYTQLAFESNGQRLNYEYGTNITLGDFNGDSTLDAFVKNTGNCRIYFGDGHGLFTQSSQVLTNEGYSYDKPAAGDINSDGKLEVIEKNVVFLNDGNGKFTADTSLIKNSAADALVQPQLADLNSDGLPDLVAIANNRGIRVFYNEGSGRFTDTGQKILDSIFTGKSIIAHIALGDVNADGYNDIVCTGWYWEDNTACPNRVLFGDNQGNFHDSGQLLDEGTSHVFGIKLGDLNSDGYQDIVMLFGDDNRAGKIFWNDGTGHFTTGTNISGKSSQGIAIGDFDGNGTQDLFVVQAAPSRVWLNDGAGHFQDSGVNLGNNSFTNVVTGDFNSDGKIDVFEVGNPSTKLYAQIWLNTSQSTGINIKTKGDTDPAMYQLEQNYPNPFNPSTNIGFRISNFGFVSLKIYDILGREIKTLVNKFQNPGEYTLTWNGKDNNNKPVSSGVYFYCLETNGNHIQKKMIFNK